MRGRFRILELPQRSKNDEPAVPSFVTYGTPIPLTIAAPGKCPSSTHSIIFCIEPPVLLLWGKCGNPSSGIRRRHGFGEQVALHNIDSGLPQNLPVFLRFRAFRDYRHAQGAAQVRVRF